MGAIGLYELSVALPQIRNHVPADWVTETVNLPGVIMIGSRISLQNALFIAVSKSAQWYTTAGDDIRSGGSELAIIAPHRFTRE